MKKIVVEMYQSDVNVTVSQLHKMVKDIWFKGKEEIKYTFDTMRYLDDEIDANAVFIESNMMSAGVCEMVENIIKDYEALQVQINAEKEAEALKEKAIEEWKANIKKESDKLHAIFQILWDGEPVEW